MPKTVSNPVVREIVYDQRLNAIRIGISTYDPLTDVDTPLPWAQVTRLVLNLYTGNDPAAAPAFTLDSQTVPSIFDKTVDGQLTLTLGMQNITPGSYRVRLTAVDALGNKTELTSDGNTEQKLVIDVVRTATVT